MPPTLEAPSLYHWTPREVPMAVFFFFFSFTNDFFFFLTHGSLVVEETSPLF